MVLHWPYIRGTTQSRMWDSSRQLIRSCPLGEGADRFFQRSGFTRTALAKAHTYNIETLAVADALATEWTTIVHRLHRVVVDATSVVLMLFPCLQPRPNDPTCRPLPFDDVLVSPEGAWRVPVSRFVDTLLNHPPIRARTLKALAAGADAGWIGCFPVAHGSFVETVKAVRRTLDGLALVVLTKRRIVPFDLSPIRFGAHQSRPASPISKSESSS